MEESSKVCVEMRWSQRWSQSVSLFYVEFSKTCLPRPEQKEKLFSGAGGKLVLLFR